MWLSRIRLILRTTSHGDKMNSIYLISALVVIVISLVLMLIWVSKASGGAEEERNALRDGEKRREKFDEEINRPPARGRDLLDKLRDMGR